MRVELGGNIFVIECILVVLSVLCKFRGGKIVGMWCVSMVLFVLGGLIRIILCLFVVVILRACLIFCCFFILEKLILKIFCCLKNLLWVSIILGLILRLLLIKLVVFFRLFILYIFSLFIIVVLWVFFLGRINFLKFFFWA